MPTIQHSRRRQATPPAPMIPDPLERPTLSIEEAGRFLGLARATAYRAAREGAIPTLRMSEHRLVVPTAKLRQILGIDPTPTGGLE